MKEYLDTLHKQKEKDSTFGCTTTTLIYSSELSTIQPNYKSEKPITMLKNIAVCKTQMPPSPTCEE